MAPVVPRKVTAKVVRRLRHEVIDIFATAHGRELVRRSCAYIDRHPQKTWTQGWEYFNKHKKDSRTARYAFLMYNGLVALINEYREGRLDVP